jgi:glyoxylase-like metal-dependent hydrolase (beta-lactamase superfamily II)/predicted ester cyclase
MTTTAEIATAYFAALGRHDLDAATALWKPGAIDRLVGDRDLIAPDGIREFFAALFDAFPDFTLEVDELTTSRGRTAVRWHATATFAGPGSFQSLRPNHARVEIRGCDVVSVEDDLIVHNDAYLDSGDVARQLGVLPPKDSAAQRRMASLVNLRTRALLAARSGQPEPVADGVWLIRGGFPLRTMNVYLIEDGDGVTVFDAGIDGMAGAIGAAAARYGGVSRVVLGHADADHRGAAPQLRAPIFCHPAERQAAESDSPVRDYFDPSRLRPYARPFYAKMLPTWDGGAVAIEGTVAEGDEVAGFRVVELPGHAPGLIGLFRESDGLALCSDTVYTLDIETGRKGGPRIPHPAFDADTELARESIRKLADLGPRVVWAGHCDPVDGDVAGQLRGAAAAPLSA